MLSTPLILGHRGASAVAPENTLGAFARAMDDGADGVEFDVRLSRDRVPVVIHDASLERTGLMDSLVGELTAAELQRTNVGRWFDCRTRNRNQGSSRSYAEENVPTLAQVFDLFSSNKGLLYVEMKCDKHEGAALAEAVVHEIRTAGIENRAVVESFDHGAIAAIKKLDPGIRTSALFEPKLSQPRALLSRRSMIDVARRHEADELALHYTLASPRVVEEALKVGMETVIWTVDAPAWIARARLMGVKALISNDPAQMIIARRQ